MRILQRLISRSSRSLAVMTGFAGATDGRWRARRDGIVGVRPVRVQPPQRPSPRNSAVNPPVL